MLQRFQDFVTGITVCYKYIQRIKNAEMTEFGLKGIHVSCLFYLHCNADGLTASQLCQLCAEDKATISRIVADLRSKGYVQRSGGKNYREPLRLTESGHALAQQMLPLIESWVSIGGQGLTDGQRESFYESLASISQHLGERLEDSNDF